MKSIDEEYWREHDRVIDDGYGDMEGTVFVFTALSIVLVFLIAVLVLLNSFNVV